MTPTIRSVPIRDIAVPDRLRPVDPAWVEALAASFDEQGMRTPIVVRPDEDAQGFILVAGAHRLAAAQLLGWTGIAADVQTLDALSARLVEIDENLMRRELGALDRALFLAERRAVYLQMHPETAHGAAKKSKKNKGEEKSQSLRLLLPPRFTAEVAGRIGLSERSIQLALAIAEGLPADLLPLLRASPVADNQAALQALAAMSAADKRKVAAALNAGAVTLAAARKAAGLVEPLDADPDDVAANRIYALFGGLGTNRAKIAVIDTLQKMLRGEKLAPSKVDKTAKRAA